MNISEKDALAVTILCHGVVGNDAAILGYRRVVEPKCALLAREAQA